MDTDTARRRVVGKLFWTWSRLLLVLEEKKRASIMRCVRAFHPLFFHLSFQQFSVLDFATLEGSILTTPICNPHTQPPPRIVPKSLNTCFEINNSIVYACSSLLYGRYRYLRQTPSIRALVRRGHAGEVFIGALGVELVHELAHGLLLRGHQSCAVLLADATGVKLAAVLLFVS